MVEDRILSLDDFVRCLCVSCLLNGLVLLGNLEFSDSIERVLIPIDRALVQQRGSSELLAILSIGVEGGLMSHREECAVVSESYLALERSGW